MGVSVKAGIKTVCKDNCLTFDIPEPFVNDPNDPLQDFSPTKDQVLELCRNAPAGFGRKFDRLFNGDISEYKSESDADLALAGMMAFHTSDY
jgi:primase-polymerase (primpol)-like protein